MKQKLLLGDVVYTEEEAIGFLRNKGYCVFKPSNIDSVPLKTTSDLVDYFYTLLQFCNPDRKIHYTKSMNIDKKFASTLVKSRILSGVGSSRALLECAAIIKCIIENEDIFNLSFKITSMSILGQGNLKWITDKAISIINMENEEVEKEEIRKLESDQYIKDEKEATQSLDAQIKHLKDVLGGF